MPNKTITRGARLQDKVCIITGTGSPRGIGYVLSKLCYSAAGLTAAKSWATIKRFADEGKNDSRNRIIMFLPHDIGARHIYAADINTANFVALRETFEEAYNDTKVCR